MNVSLGALALRGWFFIATTDGFTSGPELEGLFSVGWRNGRYEPAPHTRRAISDNIGGRMEICRDRDDGIKVGPATEVAPISVEHLFAARRLAERDDVDRDPVECISGFIEEIELNPRAKPAFARPFFQEAIV